MGWILYLRCWQAEVVRSTEGRVLPCQTKNQIHCTWYQSSVETVGMGYFRDPWGEGEGVAVMVGGWEREIAGGWGVCPAKLKIERNVLGIGLVLKRMV